jgi:Ribonuclease G/E
LQATILPHNDGVSHFSRTDENIRPAHRLEETITALEKEQADLSARLEAQLLSAEQIQSIQEFAAKVWEGLDAVEDDFGMKVRLIEQLDVQVTLLVKDGQKMVRARCMLRPAGSELRPIPQPAITV